MKKFFLSILTVLYLTVSSGIAMEIHYCMGERAGVGLYNDSDDKCGRCGMKEQNKKGCCSDEHKFFKLDDSHQNAINDYNFNLGDLAIVSAQPGFTVQLPVAGAVQQVNNHSPPDYLKPPARIFHGVFRL